MSPPIRLSIGLMALLATAAVAIGLATTRFIGGGDLAPGATGTRPDLLLFSSLGAGLAAILAALALATALAARFVRPPRRSAQDTASNTLEGTGTGTGTGATAAPVQAAPGPAGTATVLRRAVAAYPTATMMIDRTGRVILANGDAERLFGFGAGELDGRMIETLVPERSRAAHSVLRRNFIDRERGRRQMGQGQTLFGRRKDGTEFPLEIGLNRLDNDDDPVVLCAIVDMTERERAKADLEERTRDLERSNTELQQFAYVASHDLQEPLRMVASFCELLKERYADKLDDDGVEFIEFAVDGARRMKQLISSLLEYSRVQTRDVAFTAVPAEDTLNEAMFNLTALIEEREADIQWASLPLVRGHKGQLVHLFQNLIGNALKFCDSDRPKVRVFAHQDGGKWVISVTDNGIGIDPEHTEKIFGVFQRLHTRDEYPGSGMGLAICKRIVEVHGGTIWAESSPGRGTTIRFTLTPPDEELADLMRATPTRDHFYYVNQESTDVRSTG